MKSYRPLAVIAGCLGLCLPAAGEEIDTTAQEVREAIAAYTQAHEEYLAKFKAATPQERRALSQKRPGVGEAMEKAQAFISQSPESEAVPEVAAWALLYMRSDDRTPIYTVLTEHHLDHEGLGDAVLATLYDRGDSSSDFLTTVLERAESAQARAAAAFVLGYRLRRATGEDAEKRLAYLRQAVKGLGDLEIRGRSVKEMAEGQLFAAEHLGIGKVAPEIEGEDLHGEKFKLSDYRGKVVVLDFWGHW